VATVRWETTKSTLLAKSGGTPLGGGDDDHLPSGYSGGYKLRSAVQFTLDWTGVVKIVSAVLSVKTTSEVHLSFGSDPDMYIERITGSWSENSGRSGFDSPPGGGWSGAASDFDQVDATSTGRATMDVTTATGTWDTVDITDIVEAWAPASVLKRDGTPGGGLSNFGVRLRPVVESDSSENTEFHSDDASASNRPTILLTYSVGTAPSAPTGLTPTGTVVGTPTFTGIFSDPDTADTMSKLDIQVSTDSTFASVSHWNYSGAGFGIAGGTWNIGYLGTALDAGITYYYRARVYDQVPLVSAWSSTQSFTTQGSPAPPLFRAFPPRIELFAHGASFAPGNLVAIIDDAKNIGVSAYANGVGELYFTLPWNHPQIGECQPYLRHYRVSRYDAATSAYKTVARGILEDFEASEDDVVFFGADYMSLMETTISASNTSYNNALLGTVIQAQTTLAIAETDSRLAFTSVGTIEATSKTATLLTSYQPRLDFIRQVAEVSMGDRSVRSIYFITRDSPYTWNFTENRGSEDLTNLRLEWGGLVNGFSYLPDYRSFATHIAGVGVKREGASILFSTQTSADPATYGRITRPALFQDVVNQTALDDLVKRAAKTAGVPDKKVLPLLRVNQLVPWGGWDLGDNIRLVLSRGARINLSSLYTIWGMEWLVDTNGREDLYLALASKVV